VDIIPRMTQVFLAFSRSGRESPEKPTRIAATGDPTAVFLSNLSKEAENLKSYCRNETHYLLPTTVC